MVDTINVTGNVANGSQRMLREKQRLHSDRDVPGRCLRGLFDSCLQSCRFCEHDSTELHPGDSIHIHNKPFIKFDGVWDVPIHHKL